MSNTKTNMKGDTAAAAITSVKDVLERARQTKVQEIVNYLFATHESLDELQCTPVGLEPGQEVDRVLFGLVELCLQIHDKETVAQVLGYPGLRKKLVTLRDMCADAEYKLEMHWSKTVAAERDADAALETLRTFPYYKNYEDLTRMEINALLSTEPSLPRSIAFIGSGPLPLTSLQFLWALQTGSLPGSPPGQGLSYGAGQSSSIEIFNIDIKEVAIQAAEKLVQALGARGRGMGFMNVAAESSVYELRRFDVVYIAALVGETQAQKEELLLMVTSKMRVGALVVLRTSWGLRSCLYPEIDITTEKMLRAVEICNVVHPYGKVVNSVVIGRVKQHSPVYSMRR